MLLKRLRKPVHLARWLSQTRSPGEALALRACQDAQFTASDGARYARFEHFISRIQELYTAEQEQLRVQKEREASYLLHGTVGAEAVSESLKLFVESLPDGYRAGEVVAASIEAVGRIMQIRGVDYFKPFADYSFLEMIRSFRFKMIVEELEHGLQEDISFLPLNMARALDGLAASGYKDSRLMAKFFKKISARVDPQKRAELDQRLANVTPEQKLIKAVEGGKLVGKSPGYYIYEGFQSNEEINDMVNILLEWKETTKKEESAESQSLTEEDKEFELIRGSLEQLSEVVIEGKKLQSTLVNSLSQLRRQYYKIVECADKQLFLLKNPYIFYDILKVQDDLVKAGILQTKDLYHAQEYFQNLDLRMEKSAQAFYKLAGQVVPQAMSSDLDQFYDALLTDKQKPHLLEPIRQKSQIPVIERHNQFTAYSLGRCLSTITDIARGEKIDVTAPKSRGRDLWLPTGQKEGLEHHLGIRTKMEMDQEYEKIARDYTPIWKQNHAEMTALAPAALWLLKQEQPSLEGIMLLSYAFATAGVGYTPLYEELLAQGKHYRERRNIQIPETISYDSWARGLQGLALAPQPDKELIVKAANALWNKHETDLNFTLNLGSAIRAAWALSAADGHNEPAFIGLARYISTIPIGSATQELGDDQRRMFQDLAMALENTQPDFMRTEASPSFLEGSYQYDRKGTGRQKPVDPLRERAIKGIKEGLANRGHFSTDKLKHMEGLQGHLQLLVGRESLNLDGFTPDIMCGYRGNKLAIFVLGDEGVLQDSLQLNGGFRHRFALLEKIDPNLKCVYIPLRAICSVDMEDLVFKFHEDFSIFEFIDKQIEPKDVNFAPAMPVFAKIARSLNSMNLSEKEASYFSQSLYDVLKAREAADSLYSSPVRNNAIHQLRLELAKLALFFRSLNPEIKKQINGFLEAQDQDFSKFLQKIARGLGQLVPEPDQSQNQLSGGWIGKRMGIELPGKGEKDISKELLNYGNMMVQDYFKYPSWKKKMEECFDKVNLMVKPPPKQPYLYSEGFRRVPNGLFPDPTGLRKMRAPSTLQDSSSYENLYPTEQYQHFLKEPIQYLLAKDQAQPRKPLTQEVKLMTSLLNMRNTLKKNFQDSQILAFILQLDYIEQLIDQHLGSSVKGEPLLLQRDTGEYFAFSKSMEEVVNSELDAFSEYFIKEAGRKEYASMLEERISQKQGVKESKVVEHLENYYLELQKLDKDLYHASHYRQNTTELRYNVNSLFSLPNRRALFQEPVPSDQRYLGLARRVAEMKLVKARLLWKLQNEAPLSKSEKRYLKEWVKRVEALADCGAPLEQVHLAMLPQKASGRSLKSLSDGDRARLESLNQVSLRGSEEFALNELAVEMAHFINPGTVKRVELEVWGDVIKVRWGLPAHFTVSEGRNFEVDLIVQEMEEKSWREAGRFSEEDYQNVRRMTSVHRGSGDFDRVLLPMDEASLREFMLETSNPYDSRVEGLFRWLKRKERDIKTRVRIPPPEFQKSDKTIYSMAKVEQSYKKVITEIFQKDYDSITGAELHELARSLADRLPHFEGSFPEQLEDLMHAIWRHPRLYGEDKDLLEVFSEFCEFDWKERADQLLSESPVFMDGPQTGAVRDVGEERLARAGQDFVGRLKQRMRAQ